MSEVLSFVFLLSVKSVVPWFSWVDGDTAPSKVSCDSCDNSLISVGMAGQRKCAGCREEGLPLSPAEVSLSFVTS